MNIHRPGKYADRILLFEQFWKLIANKRIDVLIEVINYIKYIYIPKIILYYLEFIYYYNMKSTSKLITKE